jgi:hypothetical protein
MKPINILITGSNYWNIGDDIVREGVMAIFRGLVNPRPINWWFYNFAAAQNASGSCGEVLNTVALHDLPHLLPLLDLVIFPGLAVGREIFELQAQIQARGLGHKCFFIGGMNENNYAAEWAGKAPVRRLLKEAAVVIGRTVKHPHTLDTDGVPYQVLPCPSILSCHPVEGHVMHDTPRLSMSIQLPQGHPLAVVNHATSKDAYQAAMAILEGQRARRPVDLVCHHKSEFFYFQQLLKGQPNVNVIMSSWFQDVWAHYTYHADFVVSTRLHAVLLARALGRPGIVVNNSPRHLEALRLFQPDTQATLRPDTQATLRVDQIGNFIREVDTNPGWVQSWQAGVLDHQGKVWRDYSNAINPHVQKLVIQK